jgi:hypothetical protein
MGVFRYYSIGNNERNNEFPYMTLVPGRDMHIRRVR